MMSNSTYSENNFYNYRGLKSQIQITIFYKLKLFKEKTHCKLTIIAPYIKYPRANCYIKYVYF